MLDTPARAARPSGPRGPAQPGTASQDRRPQRPTPADYWGSGGAFHLPFHDAAQHAGLFWLCGDPFRLTPFEQPLPRLLHAGVTPGAALLAAFEARAAAAAAAAAAVAAAATAAPAPAAPSFASSAWGGACTGSRWTRATTRATGRHRVGIVLAVAPTHPMLPDGQPVMHQRLHQELCSPVLQSNHPNTRINMTAPVHCQGLCGFTRARTYITME